MSKYKYAVVQENNKLIRDMDSKAILNTDIQALQDHRRKRLMMKEVLDNHKKIEKLEQDMSEIKDMLSTLIKNSKV